jgi:hypothetical protein
MPASGNRDNQSVSAAQARRLRGMVRPVPASVFDFGTVTNPLSTTPLLQTRLRSLRRNDRISAARSPVSERDGKERKQHGRPAFSCRGDQFFLIFVVQRAANVLALTQHFDRIANRTPETMGFEDGAKGADFDVHRSSRDPARQTPRLIGAHSASLRDLGRLPRDRWLPLSLTWMFSTGAGGCCGAARAARSGTDGNGSYCYCETAQIRRTAGTPSHRQSWIEIQCLIPNPNARSPSSFQRWRDSMAFGELSTLAPALSIPRSVCQV